MEYKCCTHCVMDSSDPLITFDEKGICNHCHQAQKSLEEIAKEKLNLPWIIYKIKKSGEGRKFDCLLGMSGGVDSSLCLHYLIEQGLRPLTFTVDNGFNRTHESDENIMKLVEGLKVPFYRYTIDLEKFRELYISFIKGGIKNLEAITDHILFAATYEMASKYNIKYVITGGNVATESIMPVSWGEDPRDLYWIKSVYKKVTGKRLSGLPLISLWKEQYYRLVKKIKFIPILDYYSYNRESSKKLLKEKYGWKDYGEKHCESKLTEWFQNYYLPTYFGIDKRKAHYSSLINSGQMKREVAMEKLQSSPLFTEIIKIDGKFIPRQYGDYPNSERIRMLISKLYRYFKSWKS